MYTFALHMRPRFFSTQDLGLVLLEVVLDAIVDGQATSLNRSLFIDIVSITSNVSNQCMYCEQ